MNVPRRLGPCLAFVLLAPLCAQGHEEERARADLLRAEREYQQSRNDVERLVDMRMRHDLGLPPAEEDPTAPKPSLPADSKNIDKLKIEAREQDAATASLAERFNKLKKDLEAKIAENADRAAAQRREDLAVVPQAGAPQPVSVTGPRGPGRTAEPGTGVAGPAPAPSAETRQLTPTPPGVPALPPARGLIQGSDDHLKVAMALFRAGQGLVDAAAELRGHGKANEAAELDKRAKERLQLAVDELQPMLAEKLPPFPVLFYLGRCREQLFRLAERNENLSAAKTLREWQKREQEVREPWLAITQRDVTKQGQRGEIEVLGAWGLAAQTALESFRWMNVHGGFQPKVDIASIQWPGEKD